MARCKPDAALPPVLLGPGLDDGERNGPQGLVAEYYHRELRVLTTLMVPCLHTSQHKVRPGHVRVMTHEPVARVPALPRVSYHGGLRLL